MASQVTCVLAGDSKPAFPLLCAAEAISPLLPAAQVFSFPLLSAQVFFFALCCIGLQNLCLVLHRSSFLQGKFVGREDRLSFHSLGHIIAEIQPFTLAVSGKGYVKVSLHESQDCHDYHDDGPDMYQSMHRPLHEWQMATKYSFLFLQVHSLYHNRTGWVVSEHTPQYKERLRTTKFCLATQVRGNNFSFDFLPLKPSLNL